MPIFYNIYIILYKYIFDFIKLLLDSDVQLSLFVSRGWEDRRMSPAIIVLSDRNLITLMKALVKSAHKRSSNQMLKRYEESGSKN